MGFGRFLQRAVKDVGKTVRGVGKAVGIRSSGGGRAGAMGRVVDAVRQAAPQAMARAAPQAEGVSQAVQEASDAQRAVARSLGRAFSKGGSVSSGRGDGIAVRGKTKCKMY